MTHDQAPHLLRGAACAIRAFGLHQTEFFPGSASTDRSQREHWHATVREWGGPPPMCVIGALRFAATGCGAYVMGDDGALSSAFDALARYLQPKQEENEAVSCDIIVAWSDNPGNTAPDVAATLDASAETAEVLAHVYIGAGNAYAAMPDAHGAPFLLSTGLYAEGGYSHDLEDWCEVEVNEPEAEIAAAKAALGIA